MEENMGFIYYLFILMIICYPICTAIHELGHWYFVKLTNNILIELRLGRGKRNDYLFKIGDLEVKKLFFLPGSVCVWEFKDWDNYKQDAVLIMLGGCIANFLTLILTLPVGVTLSLLNVLPALGAFCLIMASISGYQLFVNLIPLKGRDGYEIINYCTKSKEELILEHKEFDRIYFNENVS